MTDGTSAHRATPPATLRALTRSRSLGLELSDRLLTHVPDLGDTTTQRLLDAWVEQAADTLRALAEACEERLLALAVPATGADPADLRHGSTVSPTSAMQGERE